MATWPAYNAGSARIGIRPQLHSAFRTDLKRQLKPINETFTVFAAPQLAKGFRVDLRTKVATAAKGIDAKIDITPNLRPNFKGDLRTKLNTATNGMRIDIETRAVLAPGFRTDLRSKLSTATAGLNAKVGVDVTTTGVKSKIRNATKGLASAKIPVDVDVTQANLQLQTFRTAQAAIPLTMNVNVDTALATAQLMALRSLASAVGTQVGEIGSDSVAGGRRRLRGNLITRPIRAIRLQIEIDKQSVARAEAKLANVQTRLSQARDSQTDAVGRLNEAEARHNEIMSNGNSTVAQRIAATNRLARARRAASEAAGRVTGLMGEEDTSRRNVDRANRDQNSFRRIGRLAAAGFNGLTSAIGATAENMLSLRNLTNIATVALVGLAAVSLVPLLGQLSQAAGVLALLPTVGAAAAAVIGTLAVGLNGVGDAFSAAKKAADSADEDQAASAKKVQSAERGIVSAERGVRDAHKATASAQKDLTKARKDAAEEIDDLNRALGRVALTEEAAAIAVAEAQRELYQTFMDPDSDAIDRARAQNNVKQALADQDDLRRSNRKLAETVQEANEKGVEGSDAVVEAKDRVTAAQEAESDATQALADAYETLAEAQTESSKKADAFNEAMEKLSPNAQAFVRAILDLRESYGGLRRDVQDALFDKLGDSITSLANKSLPTLKDGLTGIATEINQGVRRAMADWQSDATQSTLATIFDNVKNSVGSVVDGINNLVIGFLNLASVGSEFLPGMSTSFETLTLKFREWTENPENQEKFRNFLRDSLDTLKQIVGIAGKMGGLVKRIFGGSDDVGEGWLVSISETLDRWNKFLDTPEGQEKMRKFFEGVKKTVSDIAGVLSTVGRWIDKIDGWNLGEKAKNSPLGIVSTLTDDDKSNVDKAKETGSSLWNNVVQGNFATRLGWKVTGEPLVEKAKAEWGIAGDLGSGVGDWIQGQGQRVADNLPGIMVNFKKLGNQFTTFGTDGESMKTKVGDAFTSLKLSVGEFQTDWGTKWDTVKTVGGAAIDHLVGDQVLGKLTTKFEGLPGWFDGIVAKIGTAWDALPGKLEGPINSVISTLNQFGEMWNKVADKLGLPKWDPIKSGTGTASRTPNQFRPVPGRARGGPGGPYVSGRIDGPGNRWNDQAGEYRLARGEHVWTTDEVEAAGGHEAMYAMRRNVLAGGGKQSRGDGFADGGGIRQTSDPLDPIQLHLWDLVRNAIPSAVLTSGKRFADVGSGFDLHMQGKAIDLGGPMKQIAQWIYRTYPQSAELIHWPLDGFQNIKNGSPLNYGAATNDAHRDHVHWAANDFLTQLSDEDKASLFDRVRSGLGGLFSSGRGLLVENLVGKPLRGIADNVPEIGGLGEFGKFPKAFAQKMAQAITSWVSERFGGSSDSPTDYDLSAGVEQWRDMAKEAMRRVGFDADNDQQVNAMLAQIQSESGGNPNIAQQITDINGTGEQAGVGLLQVIPGTYEAYRDPELPNNRRDAFSNMVAALRYYKSRHGDDLTKEWGKGHGYDQGGVFPHGTFGFNMSGLPEAVLTNPQWKLFTDFVNKVPGFNNRLQALPQPLGGGTNPDGTPGTFGVPITPGVDTFEKVFEKGKERFENVGKTGFDDLVSSTLGPLGLPDPRSLIPSEVGAYKDTWDKWQVARAASAQASQALADSGYQAAPSPVGSANSVVQSGGSNGSMTSNDYSTTINIQTADNADAFRRAQQIADLRAIQHA
ncbi:MULTISPECIES: hypothetical protein [Nocardia]|uniref:hypothetical protein n=1 Tax=Nocardia TaxID=1817 RepID=UPI000D69A63F|nr:MULTISPECIES: hypothetical protein [Nocardia]